MAPPLTRAPPVKRMQSVTEDPMTTRKRNKFGKAIGVTAAECTAVCCCCPCGILELLVLAFYKFPARLCQKACRWRKRRRMKKMKKEQDLIGPTKRWSTRHELEVDLDRMMGRCGSADHDDYCARAVDFENKMWDQFRETGFWRSPSQRERGD